MGTPNTQWPCSPGVLNCLAQFVIKGNIKERVLHGFHWVPLKTSLDVCLLQVPAIQQRRIVAYLNQFVVHTVRFLNRFSIVCEEVSASIVSIYLLFFKFFDLYLHLQPSHAQTSRRLTSDLLSPQKLANISLRIQQIETTLSILEAKVGPPLRKHFTLLSRARADPLSECCRCE